MKKQFVAICLAVLMLPTCLSTAYANEGYALSSRNFMPETLVGLLDKRFSIGDETKPVFIIEHDPTQGTVDYVSWISYDTLSEISLGWKTSAVIVFNTTMNAYFLRISYVPTISVNGQLEYCALGTSNGFCYGSKATEKSEVNIDNSVTINKTTVIHNPYISTVVGSASKLATDVTTGIKNVLDWLDLQVDAIMLVNQRLDVTNDLLYWIASNFQDMMYAIGRADLLIANVGIYQLEELYRLEDFIAAVNQNQVSAYYAQNDFFFRILDKIDNTTQSITSRLDSVINNGAVQVNTSSIDARLDKLISMYSKVNSVVLDTASVTGGQIKEAVGGQLDDVVFWGNSSRVFPYLQSAPVNYTLNGETAQYQLTAPDGTPIVLRMVALGSSIPAYIANDPVLSAGVWRSGNTYVISDTYNATTGVYTQRIKEYVFTGTESGMGVRARANGSVLFWRSYTGDAQLSARSSHFTFVDSSPAIHPDGSTDLTITNNTCTYYNGRFALASTSLTTLDGWKTWLAKQYAAGTPVTMYYVDGAVSGWTAAPVSIGSGQTIPIPEGDSLISADLLRITAKYETYGSYTRTADIISAINGLSLGTYDDTNVIAAITSLESTLSKPAATVTADLTEVTSRLDTLIDNSASKIENTTIDITNDNDAFNVFYITGDDGETQPITDFAKDLSSASGKFLSVLYRLAFSDALNSASSDLGNLEDFFTSTEPEETSTQSVDSAVEEVDVWSAF